MCLQNLGDYDMLNIKALKYLSRYIAVACLLVTSIFMATPIMAASSVTFSWLANPSDENVLGYHLYYCTQSRFNEDSSTKQDFAYSRLIDLNNGILCLGPQYSECQNLDSSQLECENLYGENPKCTLSGLDGTLHFAMTAYSSSAESGYTAELTWTDAQKKAFITMLNLLLLED